MMTLLRGLHAIAAQRCDGLRPELLDMITPSPAWSNIEKMASAFPAKGASASQGEESEKPVSSAEIVTLPIQKR
jgi:hypothetical protein